MQRTFRIIASTDMGQMSHRNEYKHKNEDFFDDGFSVRIQSFSDIFGRK